jgi:glycosyltransferase involved in cell wall biosynthesis
VIAPTVSVVIPARDGERYLAEAIGSARSQLPAPLEVIVVDDGSRDATLRIALDEGAAVVRQPPRGPGAARNLGARAAAGELLAFLDADDRFTPGRLAVLLATLAADASLDGAMGSATTFITPEREAALRGRVHCPDGPQRGAAMGTLLLRRSVFLASGGFDESLAGGEAIDWFHRVRCAGTRFASLSEVVLERRIHGENMTLTDPAVRRAYVHVARAALARRRAGQAQGGPR